VTIAPDLLFSFSSPPLLLLLIHNISKQASKVSFPVHPREREARTHMKQNTCGVERAVQILIVQTLWHNSREELENITTQEKRKMASTKN